MDAFGESCQVGNWPCRYQLGGPYMTDYWILPEHDHRPEVRPSGAACARASHLPVVCSLPSFAGWILKGHLNSGEVFAHFRTFIERLNAQETLCATTTFLNLFLTLLHLLS